MKRTKTVSYLTGTFDGQKSNDWLGIVKKNCRVRERGSSWEQLLNADKTRGSLTLKEEDLDGRDGL